MSETINHDEGRSPEEVKREQRFDELGKSIEEVHGKGSYFRPYGPESYTRAFNIKLEGSTCASVEATYGTLRYSNGVAGLVGLKAVEWTPGTNLVVDGNVDVQRNRLHIDPELTDKHLGQVESLLADSR